MRRYGRKRTVEMKPDGYVSSEMSPGDSLTWGRWYDKAADDESITQPITLVPYASGSDYSGTLVERSNYEGLLAEYADELVSISGGHGTFGVAFLGDIADLSEDLQDAIAGLHDYPLLDESRHSELCEEAANEQWANLGAKDFRREMVFYLDNLGIDSDVLDEVDDMRLGELHYNAERFHGGEWYINEQADSIHYMTDWLGRKPDAEVAAYVLAWLNKTLSTTYVIPSKGDVLADAIHDWFLPFVVHEVSAAT